MSDLLHHLFEAQLVIGGKPILWREIIGNLFGLASAVGGMRRRVWAWPVGIVGNLLLFTVFAGVWFSNPQETTLAGQAARQVFFIITAVYGWWRWNAVRRERGGAAEAIVPRWATGRERLLIVLLWLVGVVVLQWVFAQIGAGWPAPRWYFWCDAWIFVGSMVATWAMARGWNEFWLAWIAVDLVGIPLLLHSGFYPSAVLYGVYALFVIWGFVTWVRATREEHRTAQPTGLATAD